MSDKLMIEQKQGLGNRGTQIGVQNNYGLSAIEATKMAFEIFREYYPQLRDEALKELNELVEEKLSTIPQELITPPKPRIAVPTLQNASITEEQEVRELYANLLANSMNKVVKNGVHPGFVEIIKQLSPDEAKILRYLGSQKRVPTIGLKIDKIDGSHVLYLKEFSDVPELAMCENPTDSEKYFDNLVRLGLLERSQNGVYISNESVYEPLKTHFYIKQKYDSLAKQSHQIDRFKKIDYIEGYCELTSFGESFCSICLETHKAIIIKSQESEN